MAMIYCKLIMCRNKLSDERGDNSNEIYKDKYS